MRAAQALITVVVLAWSATDALAADLKDALRDARAKVVRVQRMATVYHAKKELAYNHEALLAGRRDAETAVRELRILIDSFPARRNNLQEEVYQQWLAARANLTDLDHRIDQVRSGTREIDETVLTWSEADGTRPTQNGRFDILTAFPDAQRSCLAALDTLRKAAESESKSSGQSLEQVVRSANAALDERGEGDARFGPFDDFAPVFRDYLRGKRSVESSGTGKSGKRRKRR